MKIAVKMARLPTSPVVISLLATIITVSGCGVLPAGQASTKLFTVTGFTLPVAMAYSTAPDVRASVPGIAFSRDGARALVSRLVMQTLFDVLERNGRRALLPDTVISAILDQLSATIIYEPIKCHKVFFGPVAMAANMMRENCIIVDNTVTRICTQPMMQQPPPQDMCDKLVAPIPPQHLTIGGRISTTNIIIASWTRTMWQSVMNRAIRPLASGPFRLHFASASAVVSGN
ncbi:hypothetical protein KIN20_031925 [Parelaphostrongylus tenuis]|uniref:Uncharacterized protein n=1 Tax=Parelaphostrongylus tenuis TaxID=148309 RepID=A0AAD5WHN1_PARTN|nr:hypothetical protein KIN20_031925 [Parelaphostrongylus tenuis]